MAIYTPIPKSNLSNQIAEHLETMILEHNLEIGDKLTGEIELAEQLGVSRNILREAMAILKERGLIEVKNGDGVYVVQPGSSTLGRVLDRLVKAGTASPQEVYEIRLALEVQACGLAAKMAVKEDIVQLQELLNKMEKDHQTGVHWSDYDYQFHGKIAIMTRNSLYPVILQPLIEMVSDIQNVYPPTLEARVNGLENHKEIVEAIASGDTVLARHAMRNHLKRFLKDLIDNKNHKEE